MIIVRLLSPEPVGWLSTTNFTREWEPTLSWNQFCSNYTTLTAWAGVLAVLIGQLDVPAIISSLLYLLIWFSGRDCYK
jgi:hypothetical protein